eukprot:scaffold9061_cov190-Ochromonas_danica.AAC.1
MGAKKRTNNRCRDMDSLVNSQNHTDDLPLLSPSPSLSPSTDIPGSGITEPLLFSHHLFDADREMVGTAEADIPRFLYH